MSHQKVTAGVAFAAAVVGLTGGPALAQDITESDLIVVTADKRETRLVDVPSTVNLIDGEALDAARIDNLDNLTAIVPGLEYTASGSGQLAYPSLRGVSPQIYGDPTVTVFQDGVALGNSFKAGSANFFDLERVEVLKGPQSTLYGANSLGGAITLISRRPDLDSFGGYARASFGEYGSRDYQGAVSIPIQEGVFGVRLSGQLAERDGFWDNIFPGAAGNVGSVEDANLRLSALLEPTNNFRSLMIVSTSTTENDCADCVNGISDFDILNPNDSTLTDLDGGRLNEFHNLNVIGGFDRELNRFTWENTLDIGAVTLTSLTGYGEMTNDSLQDFDRGPGDTFFIDIAFEEEFDVFSQEFRLQNNGDGPLRWLIGAYYSESETSLLTSAGVGLPSRITLAAQAEAYQNFALFTQNTWTIAENFELGFGLRYDRVERSSAEFTSGFSADLSSEEWLPRVSALFRLDDNSNIYAVVSRGYKTGGTNPAAGLDPLIPRTYDPEYLWNYEIGYKTVSDDRRVRFEAAAYYIDWTDQQVQQAEGFFTFLGNAGQTELWGAEALLAWSPTEQLDLTFAAAYNNSEYVEFVDETSVPLFYGVNPDRSGNSTFLTPNWALSASASYTQPLGDTLDLRLRGDVRYTGERAIDTLGIYTAPAFTLANLSASIGNERVRFEIFSDNVFDERYPTTAFLFAGLQPLTYLGSPRVSGARLELNF